MLVDPVKHYFYIWLIHVQCGVRDIAQVGTFGHLESMPIPFSGDERATKKAVRFRTALVIFLLELNYMPNTCLAYSLSGSMVCSF